MPQLALPDDLGFFEIQERIVKEKVFVRDLAEFLGCSVRAVNEYARMKGWLKHCAAVRQNEAYYVTPYAAARVIVYIRAKQEADREKQARTKRRYRKKA